MIGVRHPVSAFLMGSEREVSMVETTFYAKLSSSAFASCRSRVSKPSVNQA
jgi:hypothetical protein